VESAGVAGAPVSPPAPERVRLGQAQNCANMRMRRAARELSEFYDRILAPSGLHGNQFTLLVRPYLQPGLTINELARLAGLDRTTLARNLRLLEERGLIAVRPGADLRTREIHTTELGRQALLRALPLWERAQREVTAALGEPRRRELYGDLDAIEQLNRAPRTD
jgi:DNA-binding MarR family transcriptional regulator